jgi:hypothetical protein
LTYEGSVTIEGLHAFATFRVPDLDERIRGRSNEPFTGAVVHERPDTFLVALQSSFAFEARGVPDLDRGIMRSSGKLFLSGWVHAKSINRVVVSYTNQKFIRCQSLTKSFGYAKFKHNQ